MTQAFAFNEPQPIILEDDRGLPIVGVYPSGVGYPVIGERTEEGMLWLALDLPTPDGSLQSEFPVWAGQAVEDAVSTAPEVISFRDAATRFPEFISEEELEDYEQAERVLAEWGS